MSVAREPKRATASPVTRRQLLAALPLLAAIRNTRAQNLPVSQEEFVPIGGIEQWISIRGASADNPALLFLHGGPGEALSPFPSIFEPWERAFTVVLWDQRGSGKTWGRNRSAPEEMTLDRITGDAIEIAEYARETLGKEKLVLVGQSWGSMLAWNVARSRPDLFHAYVGTGQAVSWAHTVEGQEDFSRARAEAAGDQAALEAMERARDAPLKSFERNAPFRAWIMLPADAGFIDMQREFVGPEPIPRQGEVADWINGFGFSASALGDEVLDFDAYAAGIDMALPVIVIQGRDDHVTPSAAAEQLVRDVRAPAKQYVEIDGGHFACYTNADAFVDSLIENVLPLIGPTL